MAKDESIRFRVSAQQKLRWEFAARELGLTLTDFLVAGAERLISMKAQPGQAQLEAELKIAELDMLRAQAALQVQRERVAMLKMQLSRE